MLSFANFLLRGTSSSTPCRKCLSTTAVNLRIKKRDKDFWPGGIKYYGFTYYPRPGEVDPDIKPAKLFMVQRIKSLWGQPYWVRDVITKFKLDTDQLDKAVIKNTPHNNKLLWIVKHIVKITPITFPYGEPKEGDEGYLNDKGQYILFKKIGAGVDENRLEASHTFFKDPSRIEANTIKKKLRDIWLTSRK